jgi:hypothetical protein
VPDTRGEFNGGLSRTVTRSQVTDRGLLDHASSSNAGINGVVAASVLAAFRPAVSACPPLGPSRSRCPACALVAISRAGPLWIGGPC